MGAGEGVLPHGVHVDREGFVWLTDVGRHQVVRMGRDGVVDWVFGEEGGPGHDEEHLCLPTNVDTDGNGHVFISDGYCNARVLQVDVATRAVVRVYTLPSAYSGQLKDPNRVGSNPPLVHSLALSLCDGLLLAADRERGQVVAWNIDSGEV